MPLTWLLLLAFLIYPIIIIRLNSLIRHRIPDKSKRKTFKNKKEYFVKMVYLITPLVLFHVELLYMNAGYSLFEINILSLIVLFSLQVFLLFNAVNSLFQLFSELKNYNK